MFSYYENPAPRNGEMAIRTQNKPNFIPMVRPKKEENLIRNRIVVVRFTPQEYTKLKVKYEQTRYSSLSTFLRTIIMGAKIIACHNPNDIIVEKIERQNARLHDIKNQILHIGNNINQITKQVNSQKFANKEELTSIISELDKIYQIVLGFSFQDANKRKD